MQTARELDMSKRVGRNEPCPCGSGRKYKKCCWDKGFIWVRLPDGELAKQVPLSGELRRELEDHAARFREEHGRDIEPDEHLFQGLGHPEYQQADMVSIMQEAGISPALIHAYETTGRIVTEKNKQFLADDEIEEWNAAICEYEERHGGMD